MTHRRRRIVAWIVSMIVLSVIIHLVAIWVFPFVLVSQARSFAKRKGTDGLFHLPLATPESRFPSPGADLVYTGAGFDLSNGPLQITAPKTEPYVSIAFHGSNGDCFLCVNNLDTTGQHFDLTLHPPDALLTGTPGAYRAPSQTGFFVFRYLMRDRADFDAIDQARKQIELTSVE